MAFIDRVPGMVTPYRWAYADVTTTDATLQSLRIGTLAAAGAGITCAATFFGIQTNGDRGYRFQFWADASRNATGSNAVVTGTISASYTSIGVIPAWDGSATGWAIPAVVVTGNDVDVTWAGAVGNTVRWYVACELLYIGSVTNPP